MYICMRRYMGESHNPALPQRDRKHLANNNLQIVQVNSVVMVFTSVGLAILSGDHANASQRASLSFSSQCCRLQIKLLLFFSRQICTLPSEFQVSILLESKCGIHLHLYINRCTVAIILCFPLQVSVSVSQPETQTEVVSSGISDPIQPPVEVSEAGQMWSTGEIGQQFVLCC